MRLIAAIIAASSLLTVRAEAGPYLLVDAQNGQVIAESDAGVPWYPASVTKLMTAYLAFHAMRERRLEPLTLLRVSENAATQPPSKMGFKPGTQVTLDNAIKMLMVRSANDIAVVIAEGVSGSVEAFAHKMNETAGRLGMTGTRFLNPHGLPNEHQVTTARDMAILTRAIIAEFPEFELYFRIPAIQIGKRVIRNHNRLIDRYPGADGMKTGFICSSGFNMVATAERDGRRLIAVVFGAYSATQRAEDAAMLFERGFRRDLMPNEIGRLEQIRNIHAQPYDMRDEMCNPKRKRPVAQIDLEDEEGEAEESDGNQAAGKSEKRQPRVSLLGELKPSMPPIRVFTGPPSQVPEEGIVASQEKAAPARATAKKPVQASGASAVKPASAKAGTNKPAQPKK